MDINKTYDLIKYFFGPQIDEDQLQDIVIKIWESYDSFDKNKASFNTWALTIAKNHIISNSRSRKFKEENSTKPMSQFETEQQDGTTINSIANSLTDDGLSPLEQYIDIEEREKVLKTTSKWLTESELSFFEDIIENGYDTSCPANRTKFSRMMKKLSEKKPEKNYLLKNLKTGDEYLVFSFVQASEIVGCTAELISKSYKNNGIFFNKSWKISDF
jgi:RNA polymerase sigma factor (sigma-70 family)